MGLPKTFHRLEKLPGRTASKEIAIVHAMNGHEQFIAVPINAEGHRDRSGPTCLQFLLKRIGGEVPPPRDPELDDAVLTELRQLREEMSALAERVDFTERIIAKQRDADRLAPPR